MSEPPRIPDHVLRRPIGRGAYGEVWLARNVMGAPRAVKIIWRRQFDSDRPYEREFKGVQRYEPVSRSAEGLVHVLHVGRNDAEGYFYYVMELADPTDPGLDLATVAGGVGGAGGAGGAGASGTGVELTPLAAYAPRTLRSDLQRLGRLPTADCVRMAMDVAGGLAQLHRRGLVHRDVKPGNVIYVNGRAKLADLGLVTSDGEGRTYVGTEGYIPPEGPGTPTADLYALGVALYEASTGLGPDRFPDLPVEWLTQPGHDEALELHEVLLKACEAQRERRYLEAESLQADLALLQSGQSLRRVRALERRAGRARRVAWVAALAIAGAVATALAFNVRARMEAETRAHETRLRRQAEESRAEADAARERAEWAEREARRQLDAAWYEQARAQVMSREMGHRSRTLEAIRRVAGSTNVNQAELRRVAWAAMSQPELRLVREIQVPPGRGPVVPDPAMTRVARCDGANPVTICSLADGAVVATLDPREGAEAAGVLPPGYVARWSADGGCLAVKRDREATGREGALELWGTAATESYRLRFGPVPVAYESFSFHPVQPWLLVGRIGGALAVYDLGTGAVLREWALPGTAHALAWSPDGGRVAACYRRDGEWVVAVHDAATMAPEGRGTVCPEPVEAVVWHPDGRWLGVTGFDDSEWQRQVRLIEAGTGRMNVLGRHRLKVARVAFTGDGGHLMSGGWDREMHCWDLRTMQRAFTVPSVGYRHEWGARGGGCAVLEGRDLVRVYAFDAPEPRELESGGMDGLLAGEFSADARWLAVPGVRRVAVWDLARGGPPALLPRPNAHRVLFVPGANELVVSGDGTLARWAPEGAGAAGAAPVLRALPMPAVDVPRRASATRGELVLTSASGVQVTAWTNLSRQAWERFVPMAEGWGEASPDGRWLAVRYHYSKEVRVFGLPGLAEAARVLAGNYVYSATFSPDGSEMVVLHRNGADWWDTAAWRCVRRQPGEPVSGAYVLYTPDGAGLWMVAQFRETGLHDRRTLAPVLPLPADVAPVAVSPDGRWLAVSVDGRRVQVWDLTAVHRSFGQLGIDWTR